MTSKHRLDLDSTTRANNYVRPTSKNDSTASITRGPLLKLSTTAKAKGNATTDSYSDRVAILAQDSGATTSCLLLHKFHPPAHNLAFGAGQGLLLQSSQPSLSIPFRARHPCPRRGHHLAAMCSAAGNPPARVHQEEVTTSTSTCESEFRG